MNNRELFLTHLAQTSPAPVGLEIVHAEGNYLYDASGKKYLDLIGGISVCNTGHRHPKVVAAIRAQADAYLHIMVYGELVQSPQVTYATLLAAHLPGSLNCVYFTNSGAEATEGALKLARRYTGRGEVIACNKSYHGHTMGALSVMGDEYWRNAFRPLLPGVSHYDYNSDDLISAISTRTSCVLLETVQGEAGVVVPDGEWLKRVRQRCTETGALLILDEIQTGFGRTGTMWGFEQFDVVPDIVLLGKALGGGMPLGCFVASQDIMRCLTHDPVLGHITTFGGHPVCCAAGKASFEVLLEEKLVDQVNEKERRFRELLVHPGILEVRSRGLLMSIRLSSNEVVLKVLHAALELGVFSDWFLFAPDCLRIAPPLTISKEEIAEVCRRLKKCLDKHS